MNRSLIEAIAAAKHVATDAQVEQLAALVATGTQAGGTYLGVLVAHVQQSVQRKRLTRIRAGVAINVVHTKLYALVLKGVGDETIDQPERNRRGTFARSAAATLRYYVAQGGDLRALDAAAVTKAHLRGEVATVPVGTRTERSLQKASSVFVRNVRRMAKRDPDAARAQVEAMQEQLTELLESIAAPEVTAARLSRRRSQDGGRPQAH